MDEFLHSILNEDQNAFVLLLVVAASLGVIGKSADWLVSAAVALSVRTGLPKVIIGVTVVSLGTTCPEAAVSVMSAIEGESDMALGNAVGSIICDSALILGIAATMRALPLDPSIVGRQAWIQLGAGFLLVLSCLPFTGLGDVFEKGGNLPEVLGIFFLALLGVYFWLSVKWAKQHRARALDDEIDEAAKDTHSVPFLIGKLVFSLSLVVLGSKVLIPGVTGLAKQANVPESVISATLVAFGTSLPELVTAITATRRGHGELAVGNVIGADILNVLFVAGAAAAVTPSGLDTPPHFFSFQFPVMLVVLLVLRIGFQVGKTELRRPFGIGLIALYGIYLVVNVIVFGIRPH